MEEKVSMISHMISLFPGVYTGCRLLQDLILFSIMTMSTCYTVIKRIFKGGGSEVQPPPPLEFFFFGRGVKNFCRGVG